MGAFGRRWTMDRRRWGCGSIVLIPIVHRPSSIVRWVADHLQRFQRGSLEDGHAGEEGAVGGVEEVVAPVHGAPQGLLAGGEVEGAAGEELERTCEAGEEGLGGEEPYTGGGELY